MNFVTTSPHTSHLSITSNRQPAPAAQQDRIKSLFKRKVSIGSIKKPVYEYLKWIGSNFKATDLIFKGSAGAWAAKKKTPFRDLDFAFEVKGTDLPNLIKKINDSAKKDHFPISIKPPVNTENDEFLMLKIASQPNPIDVVLKVRSKYESVGSVDGICYHVKEFVDSDLKNKSSITIDVAKEAGVSLEECLRDIEEMRSSYPNAKHLHEGLRAYNLRLTKGIIPRNFQHEIDFCETFFAKGHRSGNFEKTLTSYLVDHFEHSIPSRVIFLLNLEQIFARSDRPEAISYRRRIIHAIHHQLGIPSPMNNHSLEDSAQAMIAYLDVTFGEAAKSYALGRYTLHKVPLPNGSTLVTHQRTVQLSSYESLALTRFKSYFLPPPPKVIEAVETVVTATTTIIAEPKEPKEKKEEKSALEVNNSEITEIRHSITIGPKIPQKLKTPLRILNMTGISSLERVNLLMRYLQNHSIPNILEEQLAALIHDVAKNDLLSALPLLKCVLPKLHYSQLNHEKISEYLQTLIALNNPRETLEFFAALHHGKGIREPQLNELGDFLLKSHYFSTPEGVKFMIDFLKEKPSRFSPNFIDFCLKNLLRPDTTSLTMKILDSETELDTSFIRLFIARGQWRLIPDIVMEKLLQTTQELDEEVINAIKNDPQFYIKYSSLIKSLDKKRFSKFFKSYCSQPQVQYPVLSEGMYRHWILFRGIQLIKDTIPAELFKRYPELHADFKIIDTRRYDLVLIDALSQVPREVTDPKQVAEYYKKIFDEYISKVHALNCSTDIREIEKTTPPPYLSALLTAHIQFLIGSIKIPVGKESLEPNQVEKLQEALDILVSNMKMDKISLDDFATICRNIFYCPLVSKYPSPLKQTLELIIGTSNASQRIIVAIIRLYNLLEMIIETKHYNPQDPEYKSLFLQIRQLNLSLFNQNEIDVICATMFRLSSLIADPYLYDLYPCGQQAVEYLTIADFWKSPLTKSDGRDFPKEIINILKMLKLKKADEKKADEKKAEEIKKSLLVPVEFEILYGQIQREVETPDGDLSKISDLCKIATPQKMCIYHLLEMGRELFSKGKVDQAGLVFDRAATLGRQVETTEPKIASIAIMWHGNFVNHKRKK